MKKLLFSILLASAMFHVFYYAEAKNNDGKTAVESNSCGCAEGEIDARIPIVVVAIAIVLFAIILAHRNASEVNRYISPSDFDEVKVEKKPNKPKKKHMPRIFKFSIYTIIVLSLWKLYSHAEAIIIYFVTR